jgi:hypothetical protein
MGRGVEEGEIFPKIIRRGQMPEVYVISYDIGTTAFTGLAIRLS